MLKTSINQTTQPHTTMTTIDLTTPIAAINFLRTLPRDETISLPGKGEANTTEGDAVSAITGLSANEWCNQRKQWTWEPFELVAALETEIVRNCAA